MSRWPAVAVMTAAMLVAAPLRAADDGRAWLARMSHAVTGTSYVGEFTLEGPGYSRRMRIVHSVRDGVVSERLVSLTAPARELIHRGDEVTAYLPDEHVAVIERRIAPGGGLLGALPAFNNSLDKWYEVVLRDRVTEFHGRPAAVVEVKPRDSYRFGHRLWIDEATSMPVRTELLNGSGQVVERLRFTHLELRNDIPDSSLQPAVKPGQFRWVRQAAIPQTATSSWHVRQAPPGFQLSATSIRDIAGVPTPVSQLVLSDGLVSVSVFIHAPVAGKPTPTGIGRAGAASTFSAVVNGQQVTAVGEVPPRTLRVIVSHVEHRN